MEIALKLSIESSFVMASSEWLKSFTECYGIIFKIRSLRRNQLGQPRNRQHLDRKRIAWTNNDSQDRPRWRTNIMCSPPPPNLTASNSCARVLWQLIHTIILLWNLFVSGKSQDSWHSADEFRNAFLILWRRRSFTNSLRRVQETSGSVSTVNYLTCLQFIGKLYLNNFHACSLRCS